MKWEKVKLEKVTLNLDRKRKPLNSRERNKKKSNQKYAYLGANNIVDWIDEYIFDEKILCIAEDGSDWSYQKKCSYIYDEKCWVNNHAHVLTSNGKSNLEYLSYYLNYADLTKFITGTTRGKLTRSALNAIQIPLPPLPTQKAIAELLDTADSLRRTTAEQLQQLDKLAESVFLEMFGDPGFNPKKWNVINLEKLILEGPTNGLYKPSKDYGSGTKIIRIDSFYYGLVSIKNLKRVELNDNDFKRYEIFEGDFVINRVNSGSHLGKCGLVPKLSERLVYESNMMRVKFDINKVNNQYLLKILSSQYIKNQISNCKKDAVNQSSINQKDVKNLVIPVPPIALQNEFAKIIANIEEQKVVLKESLADSEDMFNGLLQEVFS